MKSFKLEISSKANIDFETILQYTLAEYGEGQMEKYADKIINSFQIIKTQPFLGKQAKIKRKLYFLHFVGKHTVFYSINSDHARVLIIRILHQKMNHIKHV